MTEGWHRADIIAAVRRKGSNLARLAAQLGLSRNTMYWALGKRHERANRAIAACIGVDPHEIWPAFFPPKTASSATDPSAAEAAESSRENRAA